MGSKNGLSRLMGRTRPDGSIQHAQGFVLQPSTTPVVLGIGAMTVVSTRVDFDYAITAIKGVSDGPYLLQVTDEIGYTFSNKPLHSDLFVGSAQNPNYLNPFFMFQRNMAVVMEFTNLHTAQNTIYLSFEVVRLPDEEPSG